MINARGVQHRFAFVRNGQAASAAAFTQALTAADVGADTPATVLCDGDAGLWRLQREVLMEPMFDAWRSRRSVGSLRRYSTPSISKRGWQSPSGL